MARCCSDAYLCYDLKQATTVASNFMLGHRRRRDFCLGGTRPTPPSLHQSAPTVGRVMGPEREIFKKYR